MRSLIRCLPIVAALACLGLAGCNETFLAAGGPVVLPDHTLHVAVIDTHGDFLTAGSNITDYQCTPAHNEMQPQQQWKPQVIYPGRFDQTGKGPGRPEERLVPVTEYVPVRTGGCRVVNGAGGEQSGLIGQAANAVGGIGIGLGTGLARPSQTNISANSAANSVSISRNKNINNNNLTNQQSQTEGQGQGQQGQGE